MTDYINIAAATAILLVIVYALVKQSRNPEMRPVTIPALAIIFLLVALMGYAFSQTLSGQITRYRDGDTFVLQGQPIRLCGVDTPDRGAQGYNEAQGFLVALTNGKQVTCRAVGEGTPCDGRSKKRSRDRLVAQCFINGQDIADELVRSGHACDWREFSGGWYSRNGGCVK